MSLVDLVSPLPLISFQQIMEEPLPPIDWVVEQLIAQGDRVMFYGEFGSLKTWLLLDLALHLAAGIPFLGEFPIPKAKRVLYVDEEMNERTLRRRIKRLGMGLLLETETLPFQALSRVGVRFDFVGAQRLLTALDKTGFEPDVVIVESFRRVLVGSENEARDVSGFWRNVEPILKAGKTLIVSHHMRKPHFQGNDSNRNRASGSTDILAGADTGFAIQRLSQDSISLECVKSREAEEVSPFVASMYDTGQDGPIEMHYEGSREEVQAESSKLDRGIILAQEFMSSAPNRTVETGTILAYLNGRGIPERTGQRVLTTLKKRGRACAVQRGLWQFVEQS